MRRSSLGSSLLPVLAALALLGCDSTIEVENEGAYQEFAPNAGLNWTVRWSLRKLDASVSLQAGSAGLLSAARALVKP